MEQKIIEPAPRKPNTAAKILGMTPVQQAELMACAAGRIDTPALRIEPNGYVRFRGRGGKGIGKADEIVAFCAKLGVEPRLPLVEEPTAPAVKSEKSTVSEVDLNSPAPRPAVAINQRGYWLGAVRAAGEFERVCCLVREMPNTMRGTE